MHLFRTHITDEIVTEFLPPYDPERDGVVPDASSEVIIFLPGMPSVPDHQQLAKHFAAHDYWVFLPRYRGSWESGGTFLKESPVQEIEDIIAALYEEIKEAWDGHAFYPDPSAVYVIGSSFGGGVALEAAVELDSIDKSIALSPVVDWQADEKITPLAQIQQFVQKGFNRAYRPAEDSWDRLRAGELFNPIDTTKQVDDEDILIIYSTDDTVVALPPIQEYVKKTAAHTRVLEDAGHLGGSDAIHPPTEKFIREFLE